MTTVTEDNKQTATGQPEPTRYRFGDKIIECDKDNNPVGWSTYYDEEVGQLSGACDITEYGGLVLSPWKVRKDPELSLEEFRKYRDSLPEWSDRIGEVKIFIDATHQIVRLEPCAPPDFFDLSDDYCSIEIPLYCIETEADLLAKVLHFTTLPWMNCNRLRYFIELDAEHQKFKI
jgi:hypothetical protein